MTLPISPIERMPPGSCLVEDETFQSQVLCPSDIDSFEVQPPELLAKLQEQPTPSLWRSDLPSKINSTAFPIATPPTNATARILYDLTTQLDNLDIHIKIKIPLKGLRYHGRETNAAFDALIKDGGVLVYLGGIFKPGVSTKGVIRLLKLTLDENRQVKAKMIVLVIPIKRNIHKRFIDQIVKSGIPSELLKKEGIDWNKSVPMYSWQILDSLFDFKEAIDKSDSIDLPFGEVKPEWDDGVIDIKGNFSNQRIALDGMNLNFIPQNTENRITIRGALTSPTLTIYGLSGLTFGDDDKAIRFENSHPTSFPWLIQAFWDPEGQKKPVFIIPKFRSDKIFIETIFRNGKDRPLRLDMEEGIELDNIRVDLNGEYPRMTIKKLTAKRVAIDGFGTQLKTKPGNLAFLENMSLTLNPHQPIFETAIRSKASGSVGYFMDKQELGRLDFDFVDEAHGQIYVGPDTYNKTVVAINGALSAQIPLLRLLVRSKEMHAYAQTEIEKALVTFQGNLSIWPYSGEVTITGQKDEKAVHVEGKKGRVNFVQNAYEVPEWAEKLKQFMPESLLAQAKTDIEVGIHDIYFDISTLSLTSTMTSTDNQAALQINEALMGPVHVSGILNKGQIFLRLPTGVFLPWDLTKDWNRAETGKKRRRHDPPTLNPARVELVLGRIRDQESLSQKRRIDLTDIEFKIEETTDTFSARDAKRCGASHQLIHGKLMDIFFLPFEQDFGFDGLEHARVVLKSPLATPGSSGCFVIE